MANLFWKNDKTDKDVATRMLMDIMPDYTDTAFHVRQEGDDSGSYLCVYVERTETGAEVCKTIPTPFEGWRVVHVWCPDGFIKHILERHKE